MGALDIDVYLGEDDLKEPKELETYIPSAEELAQREQSQQQFLRGQSGLSQRAKTIFMASINSLERAQAEYKQIGLLLDNVKGKLQKQDRKDLTDVRRLMEDYWGLNRVRTITPPPKSKNAVVVPSIKLRGVEKSNTVTIGEGESDSPLATVEFATTRKIVGKRLVASMVPSHTYYGVGGIEKALASNMNRLLTRLEELKKTYARESRNASQNRQAESTLGRIRTTAMQIEDQSRLISELCKRQEGEKKRLADIVAEAKRMSEKMRMKVRPDTSDDD
jgi:hypothetical protein